MRFIKSVFWCNFICLFLSTYSNATAQNNNLNTVENQSSPYLICYYRHKLTGVTSWDWPKDSQNHYIQIDGEWTDKTDGSMLKINGLEKNFDSTYASVCIDNNKDDSREYAEYGVANNSFSFRHQIWYEQTSDNDFNFPFNRLVVFGDSLSDNGNLYNYSHRAYVAGSYYMGRFSNGPVWVEYLSKTFHLDLYDWAISGVTADVPLPIPYTMNNEVDNYLNLMTHVANPDYTHSLYVVLIGANNYIFGMDPNPENVVNHIIASLEKLIAAGGIHFVVPTLPNIGQTPLVLARGQAAQNAMQEKVFKHNRLLTVALNKMKEKYPFINIIIPNVNSFLNDVVTHPAKYNIENVTSKCDVGSVLGSFNPSTFCDKPTSYLFWDFVHPTTKIHCDMAEDVMEQLSLYYQAMPYEKNYNRCEVSFVNKF